MTPVAWEGTSAQTRFLARLQLSEPLPDMQREQPAHSTGVSQCVDCMYACQACKQLPHASRAGVAVTGVLPAETPTPDQPVEVQGEQHHLSGADIFTASGAVLDGEYISKDTGMIPVHGQRHVH